MASVIPVVKSRAEFPPGFVFGSASSAFQIEGAANLAGRAPSLWDVFAVQTPWNIKDGNNANVSVDQYNIYKDDIQSMKKVGLDAYRFSISWSRVLPGGRLNAGINKEGVQYYNNLINALLANGIEPYVTLFHWDTPQAVEDEYGGFLSKDIVDDFVEYAELCFFEFGDRVKKWITLNEPWTYAVNGYAGGGCAPGRGAPPYDNNFVAHHKCHRLGLDYQSDGDSGKEPYIVTHNLLLAHAAAVKLYREYFKDSQGGEIGITLVSQWWYPLHENDAADKAACDRMADFFLGWYLRPITFGDYPQTMKDNVGSRLPTFTDPEKKDLTMSLDFLGLNYYTARYASNDTKSYSTTHYFYDTKVITQTDDLMGKPIGEKPGSDWLFYVPRAMKDLLIYIQTKYKDPVIYITENGCDEIDLPLIQNDKAGKAIHPKWTVSEARKDEHRIRYHSQHLYYVKDAITKSSDQDTSPKPRVKGYFIWSTLDNYEWNEGFTARYGIFYVNYRDRLARYPKLSAIWWLKFLGPKQCAVPLPLPLPAPAAPLPVSAAGAAGSTPVKRPWDDAEAPDSIIPKYRGRKGPRFS